MHGFNGMDKKGGSAGTAQRRDDLAPDDARLADPRNDDPASRLVDPPHGRGKALGNMLQEMKDPFGFNTQHLPGNLQDFLSSIALRSRLSAHRAPSTQVVRISAKALEAVLSNLPFEGDRVVARKTGETEGMIIT